MKALILVGGFGTRLRPLTFSKPKPLVEFCNKAIVLHQIEALAAVGVDEVVLAVNYKPETMAAEMAEIEKKYGVKVTISKEDEPLGTAGPLALAKAHLVTAGATDDPFFVFNSDVTCRYPLKELLEFHNNHGAEGTIIVKQVEDPSKYGVVVADADGKISRFVEKPKKFVGDCINAGMYIFKPSILDRIEKIASRPDGSFAPTSIERKVFPVMASEGQLYSMVLNGYWMDIGQPKDYLTGMCLHLEAIKGDDTASGGAGGGAGAGASASTKTADGVEFRGHVLIDDTAVIESGAVIGPNVVVGPNCVVKTGARLQRTTLFAGAQVGAHAYVNSALIGWGTKLGAWTRVTNETVLGEDVVIKEGVCLNSTIVLPNKSVGADQYTAGKIIM